MNKFVYVGAILAATLALGTISSSHVFALSDEERYNVGFSDGGNQAQATWNSGGQYDSTCPSGHTDAYCNGWQDGYNKFWNSAVQNTNSGTQQSQSANVNIHGSNNKVNINQGQNTGDLNGGGSDGHSHSGHGQNPKCVLLCVGVAVN